MQLMIDYSVEILNAIATFINTPPIFYIFSLICFCFIAKFFKILVERRH